MKGNYYDVEVGPPPVVPLRAENLLSGTLWEIAKLKLVFAKAPEDLYYY